jgi:hypothetical protein
MVLFSSNNGVGMTDDSSNQYGEAAIPHRSWRIVGAELIDPNKLGCNNDTCSITGTTLAKNQVNCCWSMQHLQRKNIMHKDISTHKKTTDKEEKRKLHVAPINIYLCNDHNATTVYDRREGDLYRIFQIIYSMELELLAILGHKSAASLEVGPVTAEPFISPLLLTMTPALSSK